MANPLKRDVAQISCARLNLDVILHSFPAARVEFPLRYLGLLLSTNSLKKTNCQFLVDKVATKLPPWQGNNINSAGRSALAKSVLTSLVIYHITALDVPPGIKASIIKIQRAFLWGGY